METLSVVFIIFIVALFLFHGLLFTTFSTRRFWIAVDYIWIGLAFIGVLSRSIDIRKEQAKADVEQQQNDLSGVYMRTLGQVNFLHGYYHPFEMDEDTTMHQQHQPGDWYESFKTMLLENHDNILIKHDSSSWNKIYALNREFVPSASADETEMKLPLNLELKILDDKLEKINTDQLNIHETHFEKTLFSFAPLMLAVAIALRLAKVTFEIMSSSRSEKK